MSRRSTIDDGPALERRPVEPPNPAAPDGGAESDGERRAKELVRESSRWRLLGRLFERPRAEWLADVRALAAEIDDEDLGEAAAQAETTRESVYLRAFGPGGTISPREVAYWPMHDPGRLLAELAGIYNAFAWNPRAEDPADHVAIEIGFVSYLLLKEAYAVKAGMDEQAVQAREARTAFLAEHLAGFSDRLARRLEDEPVPVLPLAAAVLKRECAPHAGATGRSARELPVVDDGPLCCGTPDG